MKERRLFGAAPQTLAVSAAILRGAHPRRSRAAQSQKAARAKGGGSDTRTNAEEGCCLLGLSNVGFDGNIHQAPGL